MNIIKEYIPQGRVNKSQLKMNPDYITIHDTGNKSKGADAKCHASFLKNTNKEVSWHFTVDNKNIYQHLPTYEVGWHAGDGNGKGNKKSVGIEICMNSDGDRYLAEQNAIELVAYLMGEYDIPIQNAVQHNHWSGKNCPQVIRARGNGWKDFIQEVKNELLLQSWQQELGEEAIDELSRKDY